MSTWFMLVLAALVLAVVGLTTAATWLLGLAAVVLVLGVLLSLGARRGDHAGRGGR